MDITIDIPSSSFDHGMWPVIYIEPLVPFIPQYLYGPTYPINPHHVINNRHIINPHYVINTLPMINPQYMINAVHIGPNYYPQYPLPMIPPLQQPAQVICVQVPVRPPGPQPVDMSEPTCKAIIKIYFDEQSPHLAYIHITAILEAYDFTLTDLQNVYAIVQDTVLSWLSPNN